MVLQLYLEMWAKILKEWWPVLTLIIMGLVALYFEEKRDKCRCK